MNRRTYLSLTGLAFTATVAGCTSQSETQPRETDESPETNNSPSDSSTPTTPTDTTTTETPPGTSSTQTPTETEETATQTDTAPSITLTEAVEFVSHDWFVDGLGSDDAGVKGKFNQTSSELNVLTRLTAVFLDSNGNKVAQSYPVIVEDTTPSPTNFQLGSNTLSPGRVNTIDTYEVVAESVAIDGPADTEDPTVVAEEIIRVSGSADEQINLREYLHIQNQEYVAGDYTSSIQGTIKNIGDETLDIVSVTITPLNGNSQIGLETKTDLSPNETWEFETTVYDDITGGYEITVALSTLTDGLSFTESYRL